LVVELKMNVWGREEISPNLAKDGTVEWVLEEDTTYRLSVGSDDFTSACLDELPLRILGRGVELYIGRWASASRTLRLEVDAQVLERRVRVIPRSAKLDETAWSRMLDDLDRWLPGIVVGFSGGTAGGLDQRGVASASFTAAALLPLVPELVASLRSIVAKPREWPLEHVEHVPLRGVRRADASALAWLSRHDGAARAVDAWKSLERPGPEPQLPSPVTVGSLDHPVNRYVVNTVAKARRTLEGLVERLSKVARRKGLEADHQAWCRARADLTKAAVDELRDQVERSALRRLVPGPLTEAAQLVLQDDPTYARFHQLVRPFLSPLHSMDATDEHAPARPSYELYELWTFLALVRGLARMRADAKETWHHKQTKDFSGGMGMGSWVELSGADERLEVWFNRTFRSFTKTKPESCHSISRQRRPDIVVGRVGPDGRRSWLVLDAKYRVSRQHLAQAFESVHIYRDSLRWPELGGRCASGWLLVPAMTDEAEAWFSEEFRQRHGCGCLRLRPGVEEDAMKVSRAVWEALV
jgi:hypothetical protein